MGGALALLAAVKLPELDGGIVWSGVPPLGYVDASKIKIPLLAHWAIRDTVFPIATVDELEKMLRQSGAQFEFHRYDAKHAFANETADSKNLPFLKYDANSAELAWRRTMNVLSKNLHSNRTH